MHFLRADFISWLSFGYFNLFYKYFAACEYCKVNYVLKIILFKTTLLLQHILYYTILQQQ